MSLQSAYLRSKFAERQGPALQFMKDGFDKWAESELPARVGQMEKEPVQSMGGSCGGAMTVYQAKKMQKMYGPVVPKMGGRRRMSSGEMTGGVKLKIPGTSVEWEISDDSTMGKVLNSVSIGINIYKEISRFINEMKMSLNNEIINNPDLTKPAEDGTPMSTDDLKAVESLKNFSTVLFTKLETLQKYQKILDVIAKVLGQSIQGLNSGGAEVVPIPPVVPIEPTGANVTTSSAWMTWFKKVGSDLYNLIKWLYIERVNLIEVLKLTPLQGPNEIGNKIADIIKNVFPPGASGLFGMAGKGKGGKASNLLKFTPLLLRKLSESVHKMKASGSGQCACHKRKVGGIRLPGLPSFGQQASYNSPSMGNILDSAVQNYQTGTAEVGPPGMKLGGRKHGGRKTFTPYRPPPREAFDLVQAHDYSTRPFVPDSEGGRKHGGRKTFTPYRPPPREAFDLVQAHDYSTRPFVPDSEGGIAPPMRPMRGPAYAPYLGQGSGKKPSVRGAIVKKVMAEHGLSLPQASKYVKEHGLY